MRLQLFEFVDETLDLLDERQDLLSKIGNYLEEFFTGIVGEEEGFLTINSRIKSPGSLREKMLRHNFYQLYETPYEALDHLSDLVGLRIECRFNQDESRIFRALLRQFTQEQEDGYYWDSHEPSIGLKIRDRQPQTQKNGFEIYKIDGRYVKGSLKVNFELQIKSLVNVFWGDIEHRVLYKNYNYMLFEGFFRDIMHSMRDNLAMVDRQLMILYDHVDSMDSSTEEHNRAQIQSLLSKIIHDIYVNKVREDLGFLIDFRHTTDIIVKYLYFKRGVRQQFSYGENFIRLLNRINEIGDRPMNFTEALDFRQTPRWPTNFSKHVGEAIFKRVNEDFGWNLFFKLICAIEQDDADDIEMFPQFLEVELRKEIQKSLLHSDLSPESKAQLEEKMIELMARDMENHPCLDDVLERSPLTYKEKIYDELKEIRQNDDVDTAILRVKRNLHIVEDEFFGKGFLNF